MLNNSVVEQISSNLIQLRQNNFDSEITNCNDIIHCHSISQSAVFSISLRQLVRFANHFRFSGNLGRFRSEVVLASVA
jgi:hypothetical protein